MKENEESRTLALGMDSYAVPVHYGCGLDILSSEKPS